MATYFDRSPHFRNVTVNINLHKKFDESQVNIKKPYMTSRDRFYKIYLPLTFKLKPRDGIYLDLKFDIQTPEAIEPWLILLPSFKSMGMHTENDDWISDKAKDNTVQLHLLNKSFTYTLKVKKLQCVAYIFLLGEKPNDTINTIYNSL